MAHFKCINHSYHVHDNNNFLLSSDQLCNCPQKCGEKIPQEVRERLFMDFYKMGDHLKQNYFLQSYIEMRSVHKRLYQEETRVGGRLQRRVSCKYRIPLELPTSYPSENLSVTDLKSELSFWRDKIIIA